MKILSRLKEFLSDLTSRELNLWVELLVDIIVALYYFPRAFNLIKNDEWTLTGGAMIGLLVSTIILAIVVSVILSILVSIWKKPAEKDERDYVFSARGSTVAYTALFVLVILIIGQVLFEGTYPEMAGKLRLITSPLIIGHLLMLALMFSSTLKSAVQLFFYRRGY